MARLRRQGIYGENLPTKKSKNISPSDFLIAGLIGRFERKFDKTFVVRNPEEFREIFGENIISTYYGWDAMQGFFDNSVGVSAKLYVKSHVGNDGAVIDAVVANKTAVDGAAASMIKFESAYQTELDYGISGNRTGYTITNGVRFTTAIKTAGLAADTTIIVDSVADMKVGDVVKVTATGGGGATVYKEITQIDEGTGTVHFSGAFDGSANADVDDVVEIPGFQIKTYRKSTTGIVKEVDEELGKVWCTMQDAVSDYYFENVFSTSKWLKLTDLDPATAVGGTMFPATVSTVTYLESGADGTSPTTVAHWADDLTAFDNDPIRMIANCESTAEDVQKAIETYCKGRNDTPKTIYNHPEDQTKAQLITLGNKFQRSDDVLGVGVANWLEKNDPFTTAINAPKRQIPNVGHVMGAWIRSIGINGIHWIPAVENIPINGVTGVVGDQLLNDLDRTDVAEAGINVIQEVTGVGIVMKSFFTPSTTKEFQYANGILMRDYIKISVIDSLRSSVNEPNSYERIQAGKAAIEVFFFNLWRVGSTGNVPEGETFGQTIDSETGQASDRSDHYEIQADFINNPQADIENGERDYDSWFTYPAPTGSIKIGVGLMLLG